jgi:hypothetical protein
MPEMPASAFVRIGTGNIYVYHSIIATLQSAVQAFEASKQTELQELPNNVLKGLMFHSQFRQFFIDRSPAPEGRERALAHPHDIAAIEKCPVLLAFALENDGEAENSQRICPPVEHGTIGVIEAPRKTPGFSHGDISGVPFVGLGHRGY